MLNSIISFSVRNKLIIGLFTLFLLLFGGWQVTRLPIDAVPDITNNQVQIITVAPSFGATDIERLVTFPIEQAMSNIPGTIEIRSFSRFGLSLVTIVFNDETEVMLARQQVAERLIKVQNIIPKEFGIPEMGPITTGLGEIYQYAVKAKPGYEGKYSETELRTIQDWIIRRQLLGVQGVAEVSSFGGKLKQYEIALNFNKLQSYGLTMEDIFSALEKNNQNTGGAYIERGPTLLFIRSEGLVGNQEDIELIPVKNLDNGTPLLIRDVANVKIGAATRYGAMCYNDEGEVAGAIVMMLKGANSSDVIKKVKLRVEEISKTLPEGVIIEPFLDRTKMVNHAISTVEKNLMEGALIVVFILVLFLGNLRAGLLVASIIPLAMLFAIIMMNLFGVSGNLMSLGALDFGLIVDGAVIIVEATLHQLRHNRFFEPLSRIKQSEMDNEVTLSTGKMMNSAVFGQIIILVVYLPVFTLQGIEGKMFKPMAETVAFALLGAFILSLTYIPMMSALMLDKKIPAGDNLSERIFGRISEWYKRQLLKVLEFPKTIITVSLLLFAVSVFILSNMGGEFIPSLEEGDFAVDTRVMTGSNLQTTIKETSKAAGLLKRKFPEIEKVVTKIGSGEVPTDPMPIEASDMMVILKDKSEWTSAKTFPELAEKMSETLNEIPGITYGFQYPVQMRFNELMTGARQDVVCKIFGENLDTLTHYATQLGKIIGTIDGAKDLYVESTLGMPQLVIKMNRAAIAQYHVNIETINRTIQTAFAGQTSGMVLEGEKRFNMVVRLEENQRNNEDDIRQLLMPAPDGTQIPLYLLADIQIINGPNQIQREDAKRRIVVGFNVRNRDVQSVVHDLQQKVDAAIKLPSGYFIRYGGAFENLNAAKERLLFAVPISLLLILLLLYFAFNSIKQGLLIYSAIPLSAIGGVLFLAARQMPFSISAGVGFIALFGVSVLNGIVMMAEFRRLSFQGLYDLKDIVVKGSCMRLRPVLMTAAVASLGFLPMAISNGAGAEVQRPLATVVIGGLITATLLTLFVLPVLYVLLMKDKSSKSMAMIFIGFLVLGSNNLSAQEIINPSKAVQLALENNPGYANEKLKSEYTQQLISAQNGLPKMMAGMELGQINSYYSDNRISISQQLEFPSVYLYRNHMLKAEYKAGVSELKLKKAALERDVMLTYFKLNALYAKKQLLKSTVVNYEKFNDAAEAKYRSGETAAAELATAKYQKGQAEMQLSQVETDIAITLNLLKFLLNTNSDFTVDTSIHKLNIPVQFDTTFILNHPATEMQQYRLNAAIMQQKMFKASMLPELSISYNNMSMKGSGADGITYGSSTRFQSAQAGISVPLFMKHHVSKIKAAGMLVKMEEKSLQYRKQLLRQEYLNAYSEMNKFIKTVSYFENEGLKQALTLNATATLRLTSGDIGYMEYVMLMNQSVSIQSQYIDALQNLNEQIILINYLSKNNQ